MAAIVLSTVMDAIASTATSQGVVVNAYAFPTPNPTPPCLIVGYPTSIDFDMTMKRGSDQATFPLYYVVGKVIDKDARDKLSAVITGAVGVKDKLDGNLGGAVQVAYVSDCKIEQVQIATIDYLSATFTLEVTT